MLFHKLHALHWFVNFICGCATGGGCQSTASCHVADLAAMDHGGSSAVAAFRRWELECPHW
uniref:Uncharacterized protein n=1 Tax=Setaria viridis TaxID=4556 RepID=A0A4U6T0D8_SETVI|nr:hypothetical protein SEVIR_9G264650v2 [Setaria viridis]